MHQKKKKKKERKKERKEKKKKERKEGRKIYSWSYSADLAVPDSVMALYTPLAPSTVPGIQHKLGKWLLG